MSRSQQERKLIFGTPLSGHSLNQEKLKVSRQGREKLDGQSNKVMHAEERHQAAVEKLEASRVDRVGQRVADMLSGHREIEDSDQLLREMRYLRSRGVDLRRDQD